MSDMEKYEEEMEKKKEKERERNKHFLELFENDLKAEGLSRKTIKRHVQNIFSFLDYYAIDGGYECNSMEEALDEVNLFLLYHIPEKYIGNTKNLVRENAASLKKFYKCMAEHGYVDKEDFTSRREDIIKAARDAGEWYKELRREYM